MKIIKYFVITVMVVWAIILGVFIYQRRNENQLFNKINSWLNKDFDMSSLKQLKSFI